MELLTNLGHNSAHIFIDNNQITSAIEYERIIREKSSSCLSSEQDYSYNDDVFISHWLNTFNLVKNKYIDFSKFKNVYTHTKDFTHHDAHAYCALNFFNTTINHDEEYHILVIDGFGNKKEVISLYTLKNHKISLSHRIYGYKNSLGLMYQYATSYCGMKEQQDEYKFLGYESNIDLKSAELIDNFIEKNKFFIEENVICEDGLIDYDALKDAKKHWYSIFNKVSPNKDRILIGYFIQKLLEQTVLKLVNNFKIKNILLSGGVFYNVKLNNLIMKNVDKIDICPIAGDQGSSIGTYVYYTNNFLGMNNLLLGNRDAQYINTDELALYAFEYIKKYGFVNIVTGNMEFGPRALCNTSTLGLPLKDITHTINKANNRNTIMPMAPVMLDKNKKYFFDETQYTKTSISDQYMIITYDYNKNIDLNKYSGVMHKYPLANVYSGRPQVVHNENMYIYKLLQLIECNLGYKCLINTSYNIHGKPIVYNSKSAIEDFEYQCKNVDNNALITTYKGDINVYDSGRK